MKQSFLFLYKGRLYTYTMKILKYWILVNYKIVNYEILISYYINKLRKLYSLKCSFTRIANYEIIEIHNGYL